MQLNALFFWPWTPTSFTGWALILYLLPSTVIVRDVTQYVIYVGATAHVPACQNLDYSCPYCSEFHRLYKNTSKLASFPRLGLAFYTLRKRREGAIYQVPVLRLTMISYFYENWFKGPRYLGKLVIRCDLFHLERNKMTLTLYKQIWNY